MEEKQAVMCFVIVDDKVVMINRNKAPFMGMWNVVGGHVEKNETPLQAVLREVKEESGIILKDAKLLSRFTWNYDDEIGYAYFTKIEKPNISFPFSYAEGIIDLKPIDWVLDPKNYGVIEDLRLFLDDIKNGRSIDYHLIYEDKKLVEFIKKDKKPFN